MINYREIYEAAREGISGLTFDELQIRCEELGEGRFAIYDLHDECDLGVVDMNASNHMECGMDFASVLVAEYWDIRVVQELIGDSYPSCVYMVPSDMRRFSGFLQIPGFAEKYLNNYVIFESAEILKLFFEQCKEFYLPKRTIAINTQWYENMIADIHEARLHEITKRERNVFLSICIPTYNRGKEALRAVEQLLKLPYDEEIEIIVSNNFSEDTAEEYERIEAIKDSRLRYIRTEEQLGYAGNVMNVMKLSGGQFILIQSDEDVLINENLPDYLDTLAKYRDIALVCGSGEGGNFVQEPMDCYSDNKVDCICVALDRNYLTGMLINRSYIEQSDYEECKRLIDKGNAIAVHYTHLFLMARVAARGMVYTKKQLLFKAGEEAENFKSDAFEKGVLTAEGRVQQLASMYDLLKECFDLTEYDLAEAFKRRIERMYVLVNVSLKAYFDDYLKAGKTADAVFLEVYEKTVEFLRGKADMVSNDTFLLWKKCNEQEYERSINMLSGGR